MNIKKRTIKYAVAPFERIKMDIRQRLTEGHWLPGALMPSEAEWVSEYGVSRMTVNRAMRELQAEGLIDRVQGVGTFAAQMQRASAALTIRDIRDEIHARGHHHRSNLHLVRSELAKGSIARKLGLEVGAMVYHSILVHFENDVAVQCEDRYVNPKMVPDYLQIDFLKTTPTSHLLGAVPLWDAQFTIEAERPTALEARLLAIDKTDPCLIILRRTVARGTPVTYVRLCHPGSRYQIDGEFKP